ncbi:hypothetical protein IBE48_09525 [Francisella philomiragia]|uniref:ProQ/FINO family protein n=1 Tax=Francisella philomiragia TaxID=28110 RepID=A0AAW3DEX2_9GAMM|nr:ProQ/FINO family protein [Francisella philomiragia]KFJ44116.1 proQ/FINO family protein [Francisella philomiragia]MBK2255687.1 hypothetical protein [Francisella philomiragia]MBK2274002.1 hypothetical protein [Francisella philomiragia]MBK2277843.1 hypothetical protein [Francisella philomiragia]MBK2281789.1 hypothetical protein [Francisella philomiragia]
MSIEKFLKTPEGALKVREKLDNMSAEDKAKPSYEKLSTMTNKALIDFGLRSKRKRKPFSKEKKQECLEELQQLIPNRFNLDNPKPLVIGVSEELFDRLDGKMSRLRIRNALSWFCNNKEYYIAILKDKKRYDLEGNYHSDISEKNLEQAKEKFIKIFGIKKYKKVIK